ncbi:MAG: S-layer protein, partial [Nanoarchaeota archaeon]|nr:S-layer protein [Nanoarchaeota archaeon]
MNVKKQIKKIAAVGVSLAIAATTMVSALAYDLSSYPAPFVEDGVANGAIVVGASAATQDVLGAIDIAASLQADSKSATAVAGTTTVTGGEEIDTLHLNEAIGTV